MPINLSNSSNQNNQSVAPSPPIQSSSLNDQSVLDYLSRRGFSKAELALRSEISSSSSIQQQLSTQSSSISGKGKTVGLDEFADKNANLPDSIASSKRRDAGYGRKLIRQPSEYTRAYENLREFVNNSLDIHRNAFLPFLLPLFVHSYLDLVIDGRREAADELLHRFSSDHSTSNSQLIQHLASIRRPYHIQESEIAQRWRRERYVIRISERAKNLLMAWLQADPLGGDTDESRAKDRMTSTINEKVRVEYTNTSLLSQFQSGLESDFYQQQQNHLNGDQQFLKLGIPPKDPKLMKEVSRIIANDDSRTNASTTPSEQPDGETVVDVKMSDGTKSTTLPPPPDTPRPNIDPNVKSSSDSIIPLATDLLPYPSNFKTLDLNREVELMREARKRISLGPEAFLEKKTLKNVWKPSVCAFTIHDSGKTMTAARFSEDVSILGAGFSDSYIKLWNLKGDPFEPIREDGMAETLANSSISEASALKKMRSKTASNSIKMIGHSGPVYSLSFDPIPGPSSPPRHLLSSSQDSTIRLWSLDLFKNLVVYRGHREPVWDVEWGPKGIYFASASRDRTARLWCCERVGAVRMFVGHLSDVDCVRFHPNSLYLATGSSDRTCRLWDVQRGNSVRVFHGHEGPVNCLAISPDGKLLASAGEDQSIRLWDIGSSKLIKTMRGHQSSVYSLTFSAESTILASSGADCSIRIWDVLSPTNSSSNSKTIINGNSSSNKNFSRIGNSDQRLTTDDDDENNDGEGDGFNSDIKLKGNPNSTIKLLKRGLFGLNDYPDTSDLLVTLPTRRTPILNINFTNRNLLVGTGPMI
ncbi:WD40-repeat-containing domain protein [Phakopsora pachyrhizi]|nr:WD40-repeat-containing domain protein [Phakopsora pachyrhizi]